jgi:DNA repair protein RecO (recombination protein O)
VSILSTPAILLRSYPYSETSQILRFYSESNGVLSAIARGSRKSGGRKGGELRSFAEGVLGVYFKETRDLQTFRDFSPTNPRSGLATDPVRLAAASVLAELILKHAESETNPALFSDLSLGLDAMESGRRPILLSILLAHLWSLIGSLGFAPLVEACVECGRTVGEDEMGRFDFGAGGLRCPDCAGEHQGPRLGPVARSQLQDLLAGTVREDLTRPDTHLRLASDFITYHISGGTPLRSMGVLANLTSDSDA